MAGYTRNDTGNNIADGNVVNASDLDGEFDAIQTAFGASTGHTHDGTAGNGAPIDKLGPAQDVVITTTVIRPKTDNVVDLGTSALEFKDLYIDGIANIDSLIADTADINAGSIDGVTLGTNSAVTEAQIDNININGNTVSSTNTNGNIVLTPNGTGDIQLNTDTVSVGDSNADVTVTTNGTGDLILSTNAGTNSGTIRIYDGVDGNIDITPNGTGEVNISKADIDAGTIDGVTIGAASAGAGTFTDLTATGNVILGNAATDTVTITADVASSVIPSADNTYDLGASGSEWKDLYIDGTANIDSLVADTADIDGGTIDGVTIGGTTAGAGTFTALTNINSAGGVLTLQRDDTAITSGETLGEVDFQAPNVSGGGDAIVVAATIKAVAGDTFSSTVNKTSLLFQTANSGAVATRMEIDGVGNVAVDTDTLYVDAVNDRVGINNASPSVALDVTGAAAISGDVSVADKIVHTGDTNTAIRFPAADTVSIETGGTERVSIENTATVFNETGADVDFRIESDTLTHAFFVEGSSGNVGIGVSSPSSALDVLAIPNNSRIQLRDSGTANLPEIRFRTADDTGFRNAAYNAASHRFYASDVEVAALTSSVTVFNDPGNDVDFRIESDNLTHALFVQGSDGRVAIGSSSAPLARLDVSRLGGTALAYPTATTTLFVHAGAGAAGSGADITIGGGNTSTCGLLFADTDDVDVGRIIYSHASDAMQFFTAGSVAAVFDSAGNFLIGGTSTPTSSAGNIVMYNGTAPTGNVTNGVTLFAQDVSSSSELRVRDEAGNVTTLSPHNFALIPEGPSEDMAWSYYSERDGKRINVDMLKAIRVLERLSGEKLVHVV